MGKMWKAYGILVDKADRRDSREINCLGGKWIELVQCSTVGFGIW